LLDSEDSIAGIAVRPGIVDIIGQATAADLLSGAVLAALPFLIVLILEEGAAGLQIAVLTIAEAVI
jgi:hypothetical protein